VLVTCRPKYACCDCENGIVQAFAKPHLIESGIPAGVTLAVWLGRVVHELTPVYECLKADLMTTTKLFMDETTVLVLDLGCGKNQDGLLLVLARDERPWGGTVPPGVIFTYAPSRVGKHAVEILQGFGGVLQVDGLQP